MNIQKQTLTDKTHTVRRKNARGEERVYQYKMFRLKNAKGITTTVSMDPVFRVQLRARYKVTQRELSETVKAAGQHLVQHKLLRKGFTYSSQVTATTIQLLEARRRGVALDEYLHAESNNAAWQ